MGERDLRENVLLGGGEWTLVAKGEQSIGDSVLDSLLAVSNGFLGMRGGVGLHLTDDPNRATMLAGFHEIWPIVHPENAYGFARTGQSLLAFPDATGFEMWVDGDLLRIGTGNFEFIERTLDMASGVLRMAAIWEAPSGARVRIDERFAVSVTNEALASVEVRVEALTQDCAVRIASIVEETSVDPGEHGDESLAVASQMTDPRMGDARAKTFLSVISRTFSADEGTIVFRTQHSRMVASLSYFHQVRHSTDAVVADAGVTHLGHAIVTTFDAQVERGSSFTVSKGLAYSRSDVVTSDYGLGPNEEDGRTTEIMRALVDRSNHALQDLQAEGFEDFFEQQDSFYQELWAHHDVQIGGDPLTQKALRWTIFHLLQSSLLLDGTGISAKGLSGTGYDGHYFWDTEIYILPFLVFTAPEAAREALHYRYLLLDAARARAAEMDQRGALFPWRTISGHEASAYYPAGTAQYHIDADISYAVNQYVWVTGDYDFLASQGFEILVETARLWVDLGFWHEVPTVVEDAGSQWIGGSRSFHIFGVTGPDEYTAVVDDNFYTNVMARANLRNAVFWAQWMQQNRLSDYVHIAGRLGLGDEELSAFTAAADAMHIPFDEGLGIHAQDNSFLSKPRWDFEGVPVENYPLLLHYHPLVIYRHQVLKQADVVLGLYLCADEFTIDQKRADFEYYDPLTTGDSSLSAATQAIIASDVGYADLAWKYFERALMTDLEDRHGNTHHGLHMASLGGVWSAAVMGFGGMRLSDDTLNINPQLPGNWDSLKYRIQYRGQWLEVESSRTSVRVRLHADATEECSLTIADREFTLSPGQTAEVMVSHGEIPLPETEGKLGPGAEWPGEN